MKSKYTTARIRKLASQAVEKFEPGDEAGFFQILDDVTRKSNIPLLRIVGEEMGKAAANDPDKYFILFDKLMHRSREKSYDISTLPRIAQKSEKTIDAWVYGGRTAIVGTAFTRMRKRNWERIVDEIERYNTEFADWYVVDSWCHHPMAHIIAEHPDEMIARLRKWSKSKNMWFRKAVPVYLHAFFTDYAGYDISPYIDILDDLMLDQDNWVAKGMGWCLREMAKNYPIELVRFLEKWVDVQGIKPVVFKEAVKKLDKDKQVEIIEKIERL